MHLNIYLPDPIAKDFIKSAEQKQLNKSAAMREAVEAWLYENRQPQWPKNFFEFQAVKDAPDFTEYRKELIEPVELF